MLFDSTELKKELLCRNNQIDLLNGILSPISSNCPRAILVHGAPSSGKSYVLKKYFESSGAKYSFISCDQCITIRILLQRTIRAIKNDSGVQSHQLKEETKCFQFNGAENSSENMEEQNKMHSDSEVMDIDSQSRKEDKNDPTQKEALNDTKKSLSFDVVAENFSAFYSTLSTFFKQSGYNQTHFVVLDRIDQLPDNPADLMSCFARLTELCDITNIVIIFVINTLEPRPFITTAIPHIHFPRYNGEEVKSILSRHVLCSFPKANEDINHTQQQEQRLWTRYVSVLFDSLSAFTNSDIRILKEIAFKIWPAFIDPILQGTIKIDEFVKLYKDREYLFSSEIAITDSLVTIGDLRTKKVIGLNTSTTYDLPIQSKYIICASYLASYNPPRYDIRFFSRAKEARAKRRDTGRRKKLKINPRSLAAPAFDLERMLAILQAIAPSAGDLYADGFPSNIDVGVQIATLTTLRIITRTSSSDPLDSRTRWKINANWAFVQQLAKDIDLAIEEYLME